jgi:hypothetical protein
MNPKILPILERIIELKVHAIMAASDAEARAIDRELIQARRMLLDTPLLETYGD